MSDLIDRTLAFAVTAGIALALTSPANAQMCSKQIDHGTHTSKTMVGKHSDGALTSISTVFMKLPISEVNGIFVGPSATNKSEQSLEINLNQLTKVGQGSVDGIIFKLPAAAGASGVGIFEAAGQTRDTISTDEMELEVLVDGMLVFRQIADKNIKQNRNFIALGFDGSKRATPELMQEGQRVKQLSERIANAFANIVFRVRLASPLGAKTYQPGTGPILLQAFPLAAPIKQMLQTLDDNRKNAAKYLASKCK